MVDNRIMPYAIVAIAIIAILAATPVIFSSAEATAASAPSVVHVQGKGKVICADGTKIHAVHIDLVAENYDGITYGHFEMYQNKQGLYQYGDLYRGKITTDGYRLTGIEDFSMCGGSLVPTTIVIRGDCGFTVDVIFKAANGDKGRFTGNAACIA